MTVHVPALGPATNSPATNSPATDSPAAGSPTSRVVRRMARVAVLTPVPSGLWRIAGACGVPLGFGVGSDLHQSELDAGLRVYLVALSVLAEALAFLTLGLVRRWGEVLPRWVPWLGGRTVPPMAAFVPAILGASVLTLLGVVGAVTWNGADNMGAPTRRTAPPTGS